MRSAVPKVERLWVTSSHASSIEKTSTRGEYTSRFDRDVHMEIKKPHLLDVAALLAFDVADS